MFIFIGVLLGTALFFVWLALTLIAAIKASEGGATAIRSRCGW